MSTEKTSSVAPVQSIVRQLIFHGNHHQIQRAEALGFVFMVGPRVKGGWRWCAHDKIKQSKTYSWRSCDTRDQAFENCNREWQEILEPYLEV